MGLAVKMDVDKLCYHVISQAFRKGKSTENSYSLGLYIKPVIGKQNSRYLKTQQAYRTGHWLCCSTSFSFRLFHCDDGSLQNDALFVFNLFLIEG